MSPEKQRIAIAGACPNLWESTGWEWCQGYLVNLEQMRTIDPLRDLNAMHEAEKVIPIDLLEDYADWLHENNSSGGPPAQLCHWHATAAQRAEAFLRTLNLWTE